MTVLLSLRSDFSIVLKGEDISFSIGGMIVAIRLFLFNYQRSVVSSIVRELNEYNQELRKDSRGRELSNFVHYWQVLIFGSVTVLGGGIAIPQTIFAIYSQSPYYEYALPIKTTDFSLGFWLICIFQGFTITASTITSCFQECIVNDMFTQMILNCRLINLRLKSLRCGKEINEEEEVEKLKKIIKDVQVIEG